ncbi:MAG: VWA domain-containing protein [Candidatus Hydrogenedentota bacterium]|nr:MAG: VWA domain-containing protein [Candidatus Hydrogenedentota bacterium]
MLIGFFYELHKSGISIGTQQILDFYTGFQKGLVRNIDDLYLFARLCFIKKPTDMDLYDRIFAQYFYNVSIPAFSEQDGMDILSTREFRQWLSKAYENGDLPRHPSFLSAKELLEKFWETVREQLSEHHGGSRWVGTGGTSPFGHSGFTEGGMNVFGPAKNFSAIKNIGRRKYVSYSDRMRITKSNLLEALRALKALKPHGAYSHLDIDETIYRSAKNGGEIELIFKQEIRDKLSLVLLVDNGGSSMLPYVEITNELFHAMQKNFRNFQEYFFHNTIYSYVYKDEMRDQPYATERLLTLPEDTRIVIMGDASMGPQELLGEYGNINYGEEEPTPSIEWLKKIRTRFSYCVWINPIPKEEWEYSNSLTLKTIAALFPMTDLTIGGIKEAVTLLSENS